MADPSMNALIDSFGPNAGYAYELLAQYRQAPDTVDESWRRIFAALEPRSGASEAPPPAVPSAPDLPGPLPGPGEEVPITGPAATLVRNMEASLEIPTAMSNRVIPVNVMEENRRILNRHREVMGLRKISFTHLVAWAVVRALEQHPGMNDASSIWASPSTSPAGTDTTPCWSPISRGPNRSTSAVLSRSSTASWKRPGRGASSRRPSWEPPSP
jgi:pyruvate/2-oxoglutarate dehydrogenase complex dihydrolipoamide acyltransferase (E2) component